MQNRDISPLALVAALAALIAACASSEETITESNATPEFHGATIGGDALRSRLEAE